MPVALISHEYPPATHGDLGSFTQDMAEGINITVIICTYNRCEDLRRTLKTFCDSIVPKNCKWELLVVDNNSADSTKSVCYSFQESLPIRYIFEVNQGKSYALNRAVTEATGELLVFTDDDVDVTPDWISSYLTVAQSNPQADFFGGPVLVKWEATPPRWLERNQAWLKPIVQFDGGSEERLFSKGDPPSFLGANMACRRCLFYKFRYDEMIGAKGSDSCQSGNIRGEEIELQRRFLGSGIQGIYTPVARIFHRHALRRMTEGYIRRWYQGDGISEVRMGQIPFLKCIFGAPRYYWMQLVVSGTKYLLTRWIAPSRIWLKAEIDFAFAHGVIIESRRRYIPPSKV